MAKGIIEMPEFGQKVGRQVKSLEGKGVTQNKAWSALLQSFTVQAAPNETHTAKRQESHSFNYSLPGSSAKKTETAGSTLPSKTARKWVSDEAVIQQPASPLNKLKKQVSVQGAIPNLTPVSQVDENQSAVTTRIDSPSARENVLVEGADRIVKGNYPTDNTGVAPTKAPIDDNIGINTKLVQAEEEPLVKYPTYDMAPKHNAQSKQVEASTGPIGTSLIVAQGVNSSSESKHKSLDLQPIKDASTYSGDFDLARSNQATIQLEAPSGLIYKEKRLLATQVLAEDVQDITASTGTGMSSAESGTDHLIPVGVIAQVAVSQLQQAGTAAPQLQRPYSHRDERPLVWTRQQPAPEMSRSAGKATNSVNTEPIAGQPVQPGDAQPFRQPTNNQPGFIAEQGPLPGLVKTAQTIGFVEIPAGKTSSAIQSDKAVTKSPKQVSVSPLTQSPLESKPFQVTGQRCQIAVAKVATSEENTVKKASNVPLLPGISQPAATPKSMTQAQHTSYLQQAIPLAVSAGRTVASGLVTTLAQTDKAELANQTFDGMSKAQQAPGTVTRNRQAIKATLDTEDLSGKLGEAPSAKDSSFEREVRVEQETDSLSALVLGETQGMSASQPKLLTNKATVDNQTYAEWPQAEAQLADGALRLINRGQPNSLKVVLDSPLGEVGLSVHRIETGLHLVLSASNEQARGLLEQGLGQLQNRLDQLGCGFVGAEVTADDKGHQSFNEQGRHPRHPGQFMEEAPNPLSEFGLQTDSLLDTLI